MGGFQPHELFFSGCGHPPVWSCSKAHILCSRRCSTGYDPTSIEMFLDVEFVILSAFGGV